MGIKRIVDTSFWTDGKVDEFTPEDKYFMLYLLTCPFTTQLGIYEFNVKQVAFQLGYSVDSVKSLLERFENKYDIIIYSTETKEVAVKNYLRHSIIKGGAPVRDCLIKEMKQVKNKSLIAKVFLHIKGYEDLNATVRSLIAEYEEKNGTLRYSKEIENEIREEIKNEIETENENDTENDNENDNEIDNDNDNEVSYPVSYNDTPNDTIKTTFGTFRNVLLTADEYIELQNKFPDNWQELINRFSTGLEAKGYKYDSHYAGILQWADNDKKKREEQSGTGTQTSGNAFAALYRERMSSGG